MICPNCSNFKTKVYGTKPSFVTARFRVCEKCGHKFMTKEVLCEDLLSKEYNDYLEEIGELDKEIRTKALKSNQ